MGGVIVDGGTDGDAVELALHLDLDRAVRYVWTFHRHRVGGAL